MNIILLTSMNHIDNAWDIHHMLEGSYDHTVYVVFEPEQTNYADYDLVISYYFPCIIPKSDIIKPKYGMINCHPSLLPFNRGVYTNVYPLVELTPAGVSIHHLTEQLDSGNIIAQREVNYGDYDTGESLYYNLEEEMVRLFIETWPEIEQSINETGSLPIGTPQTDNDEEVTYHRKSDLAKLQNLSEYFTMAEMTTIREFIDITRACTFEGYTGAYIVNEDGKKVYYKLIPYEVEE